MSERTPDGPSTAAVALALPDADKVINPSIEESTGRRCPVSGKPMTKAEVEEMHSFDDLADWMLVRRVRHHNSLVDTSQRLNEAEMLAEARRRASPWYRLVRKVLSVVLTFAVAFGMMAAIHFFFRLFR